MPPQQRQAQPVFQRWGLGERRAPASPASVGGVATGPDMSGGGGGGLLQTALSLTNLGMNLYDRFYGEDAAKMELYRASKEATIEKSQMDIKAAKDKEDQERVNRRVEGLTGQKAGPEVMQHFQGTQAAMRDKSTPEIAPLASPTVTRPDGLNVPNLVVKPYTDVTPIIGREGAALRTESERAVERMPAGSARDRLRAEVVHGPRIMLPGEVPETFGKYAAAGTAAGTEALKEREVGEAQSMDVAMQKYRATGDTKYLETAISHTGGGAKQLIDIQTERGKNIVTLMEDVAKREAEVAAAKTPEQRNLAVERFNMSKLGVALATGQDQVRISSRVTTPGIMGGLLGDTEQPMRSILVDRDTANRYLTRQIDETTPEGLLTIAGIEAAVGKQANDRFTAEDAAKVSDWIDKRPGAANPQTREEAKLLVRQFADTAPAVGAPSAAGPPTPTGPSAVGAQAPSGVEGAPGTPGAIPGRAPGQQVMTPSQVVGAVAPNLQDPQFQEINRYTMERYKTTLGGLPAVLQQQAIREFQAGARATGTVAPPQPPAVQTPQVQAPQATRAPSVPSPLGVPEPPMPPAPLPVQGVAQAPTVPVAPLAPVAQGFPEPPMPPPPLPVPAQGAAAAPAPIVPRAPLAPSAAPTSEPPMPPAPLPVPQAPVSAPVVAADPRRNYVGQVQEAQTFPTPRPGVEPPGAAPVPTRPPMPVPQSPRTGPNAVFAPHVGPRHRGAGHTLQVGGQTIQIVGEYPTGHMKMAQARILPRAEAEAAATRAATRYGVPIQVMRGVVDRESSWRQDVVGDTQEDQSEPSFGFGGMKISTAKKYGGKSPLDPIQNLEATAEHLATLANKYRVGGAPSWPLAVAAYNRGEPAFKSAVTWGPITRKYIAAVFNIPEPDDKQINALMVGANLKAYTKPHPKSKVK